MVVMVADHVKEVSHTVLESGSCPVNDQGTAVLEQEVQVVPEVRADQEGPVPV